MLSIMLGITRLNKDALPRECEDLTDETGSEAAASPAGPRTEPLCYVCMYSSVPK
jgi:hypothetical protein